MLLVGSTKAIESILVQFDPYCLLQIHPFPRNERLQPPTLLCFTFRGQHMRLQVCCSVSGTACWSSSNNHLQASQACRRWESEKCCRDIQFTLDDWVFLHIQLYHFWSMKSLLKAFKSISDCLSLWTVGLASQSSAAFGDSSPVSCFTAEESLQWHLVHHHCYHPSPWWPLGASSRHSLLKVALK